MAFSTLVFFLDPGGGFARVSGAVLYWVRVDGGVVVLGLEVVLWWLVFGPLVWVFGWNAVCFLVATTVGGVFVDLFLVRGHHRVFLRPGRGET